MLTNEFTCTMQNLVQIGNIKSLEPKRISLMPRSVSTQLVFS